ncbi:MAG: SUMF1/EgtB/PvdO family nonheme iron enzyme [Fibrobacterota bacterium]
MPKRSTLRLLPVLFLLAGCGFFQDLVTGVEKTPAAFSGVVADSLTSRPLTGAEVTVAGERVTTDARGVFSFTGLYTGEKTLAVSANGYASVTRTLSVVAGAGSLDTLRLTRTNRAPEIIRVVYPQTGAADVPLLLQLSCVVRDPDFLRITSREHLSVSLFLGTSSSPALIYSSTVDSSVTVTDSFTRLLPDTLLRTLLPSTRYYYRITAADLFGAGDTLPFDSFTTRAPVAPCSSGMILVEKQGLSFCIDKYEVTNSQWETYDPSRPAELRPHASSCNKCPATFVDIFKADTFCQSKGKRLCTADQWKAASGGYAEWAYPYGPTYDPAKCNTEPYSGVTAEAVGTRPGCVSVYGAYDLSGNAAEWVRADVGFFHTMDSTGRKNYYWNAGGTFISSDSSGTFRIEKTTSGARDDIGFRCCQEVR